MLDIHDGELMPSLENRRTVARLIRDWQADIVMGHRPYDYHPDHRYTGVLMDDAAVVVVAPFFVPDTTPTPRNPLFFYYSDGFEYPEAVRADDGGRHRRVGGEEVAVRLGDAVAVRRQGFVAGPHAARRPAGPTPSGRRILLNLVKQRDSGRGRSVSRRSSWRSTARSAAARSSTPRRFSWGSTGGRRRRRN